VLAALRALHFDSDLPRQNPAPIREDERESRPTKSSCEESARVAAASARESKNDLVRLGCTARTRGQAVHTEHRTRVAA
jgi:hypothetical protein